MGDLTAGTDPGAVLAAEWPAGPTEALAEAAAYLAGNGTWPGVRIERAGCERWFSMLRERGLAGPSATYENLVDPDALTDLVAAGAGGGFES